MPFSPNSSLLTENNARNIKYMAGSILCERLDLRKNISSQTSSWKQFCLIQQ